MKRRLTIAALVLDYAMFGVLLNSVGVVIMQSINSFYVTKESASLLEGFKDLPIAIVSFMVASFLPRVGYRRAMSIAFAMVGVACLMMPVFANFLVTKLLFLTIGAAFALIKVSVYSTIGLLSSDAKEHSSLMNFVEGAFMVGVLSGYWIFSGFINSEDPSDLSWLNVYWVLSAICLLNLALTQLINVDTPQDYVSDKNLAADFLEMIKLLLKSLVLVFVLSAFLYVLIEQSIQTWLPTFNNEVLKLPAALSVQVTGILATCIAAGRLSASYISRKIHWYPIINACVFGAALIVLITLPMSRNIVVSENATWLSLPLAAYLLPVVGLFLAPIYPILNSVLLSSLPKNMHSPMTGLIVLSSALGGTFGSMITGNVFAAFSGQTAFYLTLVPMAVILVLIYFLKIIIEKQNHAFSSNPLSSAH